MKRPVVDPTKALARAVDSKCTLFDNGHCHVEPNVLIGVVEPLEVREGIEGDRGDDRQNEASPPSLALGPHDRTSSTSIVDVASTGVYGSFRALQSLRTCNLDVASLDCLENWRS